MTRFRVRTHDNNSRNNSNSAFYDLHQHVKSLSFRPFQVCVLLWLGTKGFRSIQPLGRHYRRGRRSRGGADFLAKVPGSEVRIAIQIRHWRTALQRRAVDELRGYMLRNDIPLGLIVCSSEIMSNATVAVDEFGGRPIELVSCRRLCSSMCSLELGVTKKNGRWEVHQGFIRSVHELSPASAIFASASRKWIKQTDQVPIRIGRLDATRVERGKSSSTLAWLILILFLVTILLLMGRQ